MVGLLAGLSAWRRHRVSLLRSLHAFLEAFDCDRSSITSIFVSKVALRV